jgi:hypothetical protein
MAVQKKKSACFLLTSLLIALSNIQGCSSFVKQPNQQTARVRAYHTTSSKKQLLALKQSVYDDDRVDRLLQLVEDSSSKADGDQSAIRQCLLDLDDESLLQVEDDLFEPLLGNYNVSCTLPSVPSERPVGGKWNGGGLFAITQTWQHLLKPDLDKPQSVAQAVNVIVLKALSLTIHVILRGDAYALAESKRAEIAQMRATPGGLSPRTVRADFDPPRIVFSTTVKMDNTNSEQRRPFFSLTLGPPSSVYLDTTYCDDRVRIGKGSKGSLFVFTRSKAAQANDWKDMMELQPVGKRQLLATFGTLAVVGGTASWRLSGLGRWLTLPLALASLASTIVIWTSTGGIEKDRQSAIDAIDARGLKTNS